MAKKSFNDDWQAESDADVLARYEEIMSDSSRKSAAIKVAKKQAENLQKRVDALNKVGKK